MRITRTIPILLASLLLLFPASASSKDTWTKLQTNNFTLIGNASDRDMRRLAIKLEHFRHVISLLFPKMKIDIPVPTTVVFFKSQDSFKPFKPLYQGKVKENIGGYFLPTSDGNYIALTSELGSATPYEVIFHEYLHSIVDITIPNAPLWLSEGIADWYSAFDTFDENKKADLGGPIARHVYTLRESKLLPLSALLTADHRSRHYNERSKAGIFYAESWALVHYLMMGNDGKRLPQLNQFISRLSSDLSPEENFRQSFQSDYKTMEGELQIYVRRHTFPVLKLSFTPDQLKFTNEIQSAVMPEEQVQYYLGDLLLSSRRLDDAEKRLQKSLEINSSFSPAQLSFGKLRLREGKVLEAQKLIEAAITSDASNYLAHYYLGWLRGQSGLFEEAIKSYQEAVRLKPGIGRFHSELGQAYLNAGRANEAINAFFDSTRVEPKNADLYRRRAYANWLLGDRGNQAASDASVYIRLRGWRTTHSPYMALAIHYGLRQAKQPTANKVLEEAASKLDASEWPYPVFRYLQGLVAAEELLGLATDNDKLTEAHAYLGLDLSLKGDRNEALKHLLWVKENGIRNFVEYPLVLAEINRLEKT